MIFTTGNRVTKPIVEFTIAETRCRIVPAPVGQGGEHLLKLHAGFGDQSDETQVIGTCALNGRRYLIPGDTGSPQSVTANTSTA
ncbi:hypothetical protein [Thiocapsa sp.]|uniref:hypothetical protein n=1 Tax=Thiocapsa sp. TaxID=2024551 RepID=UPI0035946415